MSEGVVIWCGPVSTSNLTSKVTLPEGWRVVTVNQGVDGGIGSSAFGNLGASLGPRPITALLERHKASDARAVLIGSFSAGWGLVNAIGVSDERDDARVRGIVLADSYYKSHARIAAGATHDGITHLARRAGDGGPCLWLTTSAIGGPDYASASKSVESEIERWGLGPADPHADMPPPKRAMARGRLLWHDYGDIYGLGRNGHLVHATELGPRAIGLLLHGASSSSPPSSKRGGGGIVALCALLVFAYFASKG